MQAGNFADIKDRKLQKIKRYKGECYDGEKRIIRKSTKRVSGSVRR